MNQELLNNKWAIIVGIVVVVVLALFLVSPRAGANYTPCIVDCQTTPTPTPYVEEEETPTPTPEVTPEVTNPGGPGDGRSDGLSDGRHSGPDGLGCAAHECPAPLPPATGFGR